MRAGALDRRIDLQHRALAVSDANGQRKASFTTYDTVWAEKRDQRAREFFAAQGTNVEKATRFLIRWRSDVLQTDRIVFDGLSYDVVQISEIGRQRGLEIFASAAAP